MWRDAEDSLFADYRRSRDPRLLGRVFDRTAPSLWRIARHLCGNAHDADDLVQQTFLAAIERAESWQRHRSLFAWLVGILTNQARLARRSGRRRPDPDRLRSGDVAATADTAADGELRAAVESAVADLGDTYRPVLHLHLFFGLDAKEIGEALGRPAGSVRTQIVRGLDRLRRVLPAGLGGAALAAAPAGSFATIRSALLASHAAPAAGLGGVVSALALGGSTMKKWLAMAVGLFVLACTWWLLLPPQPSDAYLSRSTASTAQRGELEATAATEVSAAQRLESSAIDPRRAAVDATGDLVVRAVIGPAADPLPGTGVWFQLRRSDEWGSRTVAGARADGAGRALFETVQTGEWSVVAYLGVAELSKTVVVLAGEANEVVFAFESLRTLWVTVVDARGTPVEGAEVWVGFGLIGSLEPMQVTSRLVGRTDRDGRLLAPVDSMSHVGAVHPAHAASLACPVSSVTGDAITLVLEQEPGELAITVVDAAGAPVVADTVLVQAVSKQPPMAARRAADGRTTSPPVAVTASTDAAGRALVRGLAPGRYRCSAASAHLDRSEEVEVVAFSCAAVRLVRRPCAVVRGSVVYPDGVAAEGLWLTFFEPTGQRLEQVRTGADGRFSVRAPLGLLRIVAERRKQALAETSLRVEPDPEPLRWIVDEPLSIAGHLVDSAGDPVAGWHVVATGDAHELDRADLMDAALYGGRVVTDARGAFTLHGLGAGPFTVVATSDSQVWRSPGPPVVQRGVAAGSVALRLVVPDAALPRASLRGRVVDERGAAVAAAAVDHLRDGRFTPVEVVDGRFDIQALTAGSHRLRLRAPDHAGRMVIAPVTNGVLDLGDLVLARSYPVHVRLLGKDGAAWRAPAPVPRIVAAGGTAVSPLPDVTVQGDVLRLDGLAAGRYELWPPRYDDIVSDPLPFEVLPGGALELSWQLAIGRRITLRFRSPAAGTATGAQALHVVIRDASGELYSEQQVTQRDADAWITQVTLAPGRYSIDAAVPRGVRFRIGEIDTASLANGGELEVPPAH